MTNSLPERLGKYKIVEEVGRGGFAAVYKAVDTTLNRTVALKVLAPYLLWDPIFVERFQREAEVAANLDHPNIVTIHEVSQVEGVYFIAMQFLEGQTLGQILEAEGPLPAPQVQSIVEQVASALDYAHARGFVHRDIKSSNIIVADDGRATLTDFGLVKAGEGTKLSTTGVTLGTPEYMSPEQAEGVEELDARSDVYSLGVVVYEMFTGEVPFSGTTPLSVMRGHADKPPPLPSEVNPAVSPAVEAVLLKALAKEGEERYQSAGEMAAVLKQAVSGAVAEKVKAPPALHPSLALKLSVKPQTVDVGGEAKWTATLQNDGDDDLLHVTVRRGRTLLDEPFDLAVGKGRRFAFTTTYKAEGKKIEKVTATGIASTGESVSDEARATVEVAPIPPEPAAVAKEKLRPPAALPAPEAVPKKALALGGALSVILIVAAMYFGRGPIGALLSPPIPTMVPVAVQTKVWEKDNSVMVYVPAGEFIMGSDIWDDEKPVHTVYLDAFYIDKTEVTNAQFAQFLNQQGNQEEGGVTWLDIVEEDCLISQSGEQYQPKSGYEKHPVVEVTWYGARAYCQWAGKRLPTEAEWEKAARGTDGRTYPWGERIDCDHAQYSECGGRTVPVGSKPKGASPYGALDMAGNAWEWVADRYGPNYYSQSPYRNPPGPDDGEYRVLRGSSWNYNWRYARCSNRNRSDPRDRINVVGFRCARGSQ